MVASPSLIKRPVLTGVVGGPLVGCRVATYEATLFRS